MNFDDCCWVRGRERETTGRKAVCGELIIFRSAINKVLSHFVACTLGVRYHRRTLDMLWPIATNREESERYNWCEAPEKISYAALRSTAITLRIKHTQRCFNFMTNCFFHCRFNNSSRLNAKQEYYALHICTSHMNSWTHVCWRRLLEL